MWLFILDLSYIFCGVVLILSIILSIKDAIIYRDSKITINELLKSTSSLITVAIIFNFFSFFNNGIDGFLLEFNIYERLIILCKLAIFIIVYFLLKLTIYLLLRLINSLTSINSKKILESNLFFLTLSSGFVGFLRGIVKLIFIFIIVTFINKSNLFKTNLDFFEDIKLYRNIERSVSLERVEKIKTNLVKEISEATVTYYNGVTLEEGVKSNSDINKKAKSLTKNLKSDREKGKMLYTYVGSSIKYDMKKAEKLVSNRSVKNSGAIEAFETGKGVCFDYACLYVAMCKAVGIKVELVLGEAFDGKEFVSHAWNRIYLKDEGVWINVDPTFYSAGNYFGNKDFDKEHIKSKIVGEW